MFVLFLLIRREKKNKMSCLIPSHVEDYYNEGLKKDPFFKAFFLSCRNQPLETNIGSWFYFDYDTHTHIHDKKYKHLPFFIILKYKNNIYKLTRSFKPLATTNQSVVFVFQSPTHRHMSCVVKFPHTENQLFLEDDQKFIRHWLPIMDLQQRCTARIIPSALLEYQTNQTNHDHDHTKTHENICIVMPKMDGDADDYFSQTSPQQSWLQFPHWIESLYQGMQCLYKSKAYYLDAKPGNMLYKKYIHNNQYKLQWWLSDLGSILVDPSDNVTETYPFPFIFYIKQQSTHQYDIYMLVKLQWSFLTCVIATLARILRLNYKHGTTYLFHHDTIKAIKEESRHIIQYQTIYIRKIEDWIYQNLKVVQKLSPKHFLFPIYSSLFYYMRIILVLIRQGLDFHSMEYQISKWQKLKP
jgi:hypothetical protein